MVLVRLSFVSMLAAFTLASCAQNASVAPPQPHAEVATCDWTARPRVLLADENTLNQVWLLEEQPVLHEPLLPQNEALQRFRAAVEERVADTSARALIAHTANNGVEPGNPELARDGAAGRIRPMSCLEGLLLAVQAERQPMIENPSEFGAFILRRERADRTAQLAIYYATEDRPGLKIRDAVSTAIQADMADGWTYHAMLHNHNFFFEREPPEYACPCPSRTDVELFRGHRDSLGLKQAWITNGFDTMVIEADEFDIFRGHEDGAR